ncbi:protein artemis-like [Anticarsia gemmatalis]|uniref:protein artemis-like n=1 Tax=Anticarsia gemmatalis TaxID=129554 RepID=UPI003F7774F8
MRSAFSGIIDEIPFINVDNFQNQDQSAYFLSHFHGDHIFGLNDLQFPRKLEENRSFIYASEVTVAIVESELPNLAPYLKILQLGRNTIEIQDKYEKIYLKVTMVPAGHSLGSVMFLFEHNKTVLYTGDFRITQNSVSKYTHLHKSNGEPINLDALYIDTTFQNVPSFPRRSEVIRNIVSYVKDWLSVDGRDVVLITSACYGYEAVCNELYSATGIKTFIANRLRWQVFSKFPKEMFGITDDCSSKIHLYTKYEFGKLSPDENTLQVYFSAMIWGPDANDEHCIIRETENRIKACFATHCGRDELIYFMKYFPVKKIVSFPEPFICNDSNLTDIYKRPINSKIEVSPKRPLKRAASNSPNKVPVSKKLNTMTMKNMFDW